MHAGTHRNRRNVAHTIFCFYSEYNWNKCHLTSSSIHSNIAVTGKYCCSLADLRKLCFSPFQLRIFCASVEEKNQVLDRCTAANHSIQACNNSDFQNQKGSQNQRFLSFHCHFLHCSCNSKKPFKQCGGEILHYHCLKLISLKKKPKPYHKKANMLPSQLLQPTASKSMRTV